MINQTKKQIRKNSLCSFFDKQNTVLKFFFTLLLLISLISFDYKRFTLMFSMVLLYFLPCLKLLSEWLLLTLKLLPLFIAFYFFVIFFNVDFIKETILSLKIIFLLLISVYITKTGRYYLRDIPALYKNRTLKKIVLFVVIVYSLVPLFISKFYRLRKENLKTVLDESALEMEKMDFESKIMGIETGENKRDFWIMPNLYLMLFFTIVFLLLEI